MTSILMIIQSGEDSIFFEKQEGAHAVSAI
jgi:hypothetical protein